jgi:hypothetical protein
MQRNIGRSPSKRKEEEYRKGCLQRKMKRSSLQTETKRSLEKFEIKERQRGV